MGFCECTAKFILFAFNLACAILGVVIIGFSVATNIHGKPFKDILNGQITIVTIILIVVGVLIFLIAFLGCCGAVRESNCLLTTYAVILCILLVVEFALGITAFVYRNNLEDQFDTLIEKSFLDDHLKDIVNEIQLDFKCCGVDGPAWWGTTIPESCCGLTGAKSINVCTITKAYTEGCESKIVNFISKELQVLGGVAIGIAVIELICVIFSFCLANNYKKWR